MQLAQFAPLGIAHWDGQTLAAVRYPTGDPIKGVAADSNSVFVTTGTEYRVIARMAVP